MEKEEEEGWDYGSQSQPRSDDASSNSNSGGGGGLTTSGREERDGRGAAAASAPFLPPIFFPISHIFIWKKREKSSFSSYLFGRRVVWGIGEEGKRMMEKWTFFLGNRSSSIFSVT